MEYWDDFFQTVFLHPCTVTYCRPAKLIGNGKNPPDIWPIRPH